MQSGNSVTVKAADTPATEAKEPAAIADPTFWIPVAASLATALIGWLYGRARTRITFDMVSIGYDGPKLIENKVLAPDNQFWPQLMAERLVIHNRGLKHLKDCKFYLDGVGEQYVFSFNGGNSIPKEALTYGWQDGTLVMTFADLPAGEEVAVEVIHRGSPFRMHIKVRGGAVGYRTISKHDYDMQKLKLDLAIWVVAIVCWMSLVVLV